MTVVIYDKKRLQLIDMLPNDWARIIEKYYLAHGADRVSAWPDEAVVYAGCDAEVVTVLEKHGLATDEIREFLSKK